MCLYYFNMLKLEYDGNIDHFPHHSTSAYGVSVKILNNAQGSPDNFQDNV